MNKILLIAASALMLFACSKQDSSINAQGEKTILHATLEGIPGSGTKVYSNDALKLLWNADDRISVFKKRTYNDQYKFLGNDGDAGGNFEEIPVSGFISGNDIDHILAVYPYVKKTNKVNNAGNMLTVTLPAEQVYKANSVGVAANYMVAISDDLNLQFKNACGYLKFRFWGEGVSVSSIKLEGNNGELLAGKADITPVMGGTPTTAMQTEAGAATGSITLTCDTPVVLGTSATEATDFIFVVPPTTFTGGFKVTVTDNAGKTFVKSSTKSLTITRNKMENMAAMQVVPN